MLCFVDACSTPTTKTAGVVGKAVAMAVEEMVVVGLEEGAGANKFKGRNLKNDTPGSTNDAHYNLG